MLSRIEELRDRYLSPTHRAFLGQHFPVCSALGMGRTSLLEGGEDNINVLLHDPTGTPRFVARHCLVSPPSKVAGEMRLVEMLAAHGFPTPIPLHTANGTPFLNRPGEPTIALFPYVEGTIDLTWSAEQKCAAAAAIAECHQLCHQTRFRVGVVKEREKILRTGPAKFAVLGVPGHEVMEADVAEFIARRLPFTVAVVALLR